MTWRTIAWPRAIGACGTMALFQLRTGFHRPWGAARLLFSLNAFVVAAYSCFIGGEGAMAAAAETETNAPAFVVKSWRTIDGLPQNSVMALAQTADGYLWLGTRGGLARFDGVRFTTYGLADGLKSVNIWCLAEDGQGGLWIGTGARGDYSTWGRAGSLGWAKPEAYAAQ